METKERYFWVDNIRGILIFLVVFGHGLEFSWSTSTVSRFLYILVYLVHMPVFITISGYLSKNVEKGRKRAFSTYFIPFITFNIFWSIGRFLPSYLSNPQAIETYELFTPGWALWFLLAMFFWKLILPDLVRVKNILLITLIIGTLSGLFSEYTDYLSLAKFFGFTPYFIAGYFITDKHVEMIRSVSKKYSLMILVTVLVFASMFLYFEFPVQFLWLDRPYRELTDNMQLALVLSVIQYFIGFLGAFLFINLSRNKASKVTDIGSKTLPIYMLHTYLLSPFILLKDSPLNEFIKLGLIIFSTILIVLLLSSQFVG
ncbi:MAG: acyltransferase family protein, partial [Erysipelothrix sp.]|nr:acyltransferase family protein [Erysipelothrix sp.]